MGSLSQLLEGIFDYAGTFPPASLDLSSALRLFLAARDDERSWIVSRLVVASRDLAELEKRLPGAIDGGANLEPVPIAVVGMGSQDRASWEDALEHDAEAMNAFQEAVGEIAEIEAYEIRVPDHAGLDGYLWDLQGFNAVEVFVELPWGSEMDDSLAALVEAEWPGAKARAGGDRIPSADDLAGFLHACVTLDQPFKLTAGLHHPFRREREHGFLNVAGATALAMADDLSRREIAEILADERPESWSFERNRLAWHGRTADMEAIEEARGLFVSIGSCSVDEPLRDLAKAGLTKGGR